MVSPKQPESKHDPSACRRAARTPLAGIVALLLAGAAAGSAQELIYQEGFNDDGEAANPPRYTTTGRDVYELDRIREEGIVDQLGPLYWAHNFDVSFVGVPAPTPGRRMMMAWDPTIIDPSVVSEDLFELWESSVNWMINNKANATIIVSPNVLALGVLADRLIEAGHNVIDDDPSIIEEDLEGDLLIHAPGASSRGATTTLPVIAMASADLDDLLVGSIGTPAAFEAGDVTIAAPDHPAAGGKTGSFPAVTSGAPNWQLLGELLPNGATTLATFVREVPPAVTSLADVDEMIAGTKESDQTTAEIDILDFSDASPGLFFNDLPIPGDLVGNWGLLATGEVSVATAGTYSFALGTDDGGRLQIDVDGDGFDADDTVIEALGPQGHTFMYGDVEFPETGDFPFRLVAYNSGGAGSVELAVALTEGGGMTDLPGTPFDWEILGTPGAASPVTLNGTADVTAFAATGDIVEETLPFIALVNGPNDTPPGSVFGGGPFTGFEGAGFFAMSGGNKWLFPDGRTDRSLTLQPVDVSGKTNVKVTVALAGTFLDFEVDDYLQIIAYPNGIDGEEVLLARYSAPDANTKYFVDITHGNTNRLDLAFKDATYDIPEGATDLVLEFRALTTWWNEIVAFDNVRITAGGGDGGTNGPPSSLSIARNGDNIEITFTGTLETAPAVTGPWTAVTGNPTSPFVIQPSAQAATAFYRTRQ